jgi:hypothetical protein
VMWEALWGEDHTPFDLLVTGKEEVCTPLCSYQLPGASEHERREDMLIGNVRIVTSKMSCAQVRERERAVLWHSQRQTQRKRRKNFWIYGHQRFESFDKSMCFYWPR